MMIQRVRSPHPALRLTILVGNGDTWRHRPLYTQVVRRAREAGLAGVTVLRGIQGYGVSGRIHTGKPTSLSDQLPIAVIIVDSEARVRGFLPQLDELVTTGLVMVDTVDVLEYRRT